MNNYAKYIYVLLFLVLAGCDAGVNDGGPDVPTLVAPADRATNQIDALEVQWNSSAGAEQYRFQLAKDEGFSSLLVDEIVLTSVAYALQDLDKTTYFWRVRAQNDVGESEWSPVRRFSVSREAIVPVHPGLVAPSNGALDMPTEVYFKWEEIPGASTYHLQVSLEANFIRRSADLSGIRGNVQQIKSLVPTYIYYWRVRAENPVGKSVWSPTWSIVIEDDLG